MSFHKDFKWGVATSSYQIEGAAFEDGKGLSIWDLLCMKPGAIRGGDNAFTACDHYHKYKDDIKLMSEIGVKAYRFSVSWPRVIPAGRGAVNEKGLDFYERLVDELLNNDIEPWLTLYHWDYPHELFLKGGWLNRDSADWFAEYAGVLVKSLSDRVENWITLNEIQGFIGFGYASGGRIIQAPALDLGLKDALTAGHHALMAHGKAVQSIRRNAVKKPCVGDAPVGIVKIPASSKENDVQAAYRAMFDVPVKADDFFQERSNSWWMDPVHLGHYPEEGMRILGKFMPDGFENDMEIIHQPLDFCGVNIYSGAKLSESGNEINPLPGSLESYCNPESLYWGPRFFYERYKRPILVTENGLCCRDSLSLDGKVHDPQRIDFLHRYLKEYKKASEEKIPLKGYFLWTLMDNFEWCGGYTPRYGIIYVDYENQSRIIKDSGLWYSDVIKSNGKNL